MSDLKTMSVQELGALINRAKEELRWRTIAYNADKANKFNNLIKSQTNFIQKTLHAGPDYDQFLKIFSPSHKTGACLDDSPHKDVVIGGCPCARCVTLNMRNGTVEHTALVLGVFTIEKFQ